jgi:hypothetical protein
MTESNLPDRLADRMLTGHESWVLRQILAHCHGHEHNCSDDYIQTGALAWRFVGYALQDGVKRKDAVKFIRNSLQAAGLRTLDVSAYIKAHWLHRLCPEVAQLPVSVLKALLPLCRARGEVPQFVEGASHYHVSRLVAEVQANHLPAEQVRARVGRMLGKGDSIRRRQWERLLAYLEDVDECCLEDVLRYCYQVRRRLVGALAKITARELTRLLEQSEDG